MSLAKDVERYHRRETRPFLMVGVLLAILTGVVIALLPGYLANAGYSARMSLHLGLSLTILSFWVLIPGVLLARKLRRISVN